MDQVTAGTRNGIDVEALRAKVGEVEREPGKGVAAFRVATRWQGGTRTESRIAAFSLGGEPQERGFRIASDEPAVLLGTDTAPNPQELLLAALNACMSVGYVAGAAVHGITLRSLEIETAGELDLRGFLGIDPLVAPGYESLRCTVRLSGDGTPEQFREIHETVMRTSPNRFNLARPVPIEAELVVG